MARDRAVLQAWSQLSGALDIVPGATLKLYEPGTGSVASAVAGGTTTGTTFASDVYGAKTGGSPLGSTLTADSSGQKIIFTTQGRTLDVGVEHASIVPYVRQFDSWELDPANVLSGLNAAALAGVREGGVVDGSSAWRSALLEMQQAGGGLFDVPAGIWRLSRNLLGYGGVRIRGAGKDSTIILVDDPSDGAVAVDPLLAYGVYASDPWHATEYTVSGNPNYGTRSLLLATPGDSAVFSAGELIQVYSTAFSNSTSADTPFSPFTTHIEEIVADGADRYVILNESIPFAFSSGTVKIRRRSSAVSPASFANIDGFHVSDLTIACGDAAGAFKDPRNVKYGVYVAGAYDAVIERVRFTHLRYNATFVLDSKSVAIRDNFYDHIFSETWSSDLVEGGNGLPINVSYSNGVQVTGNRSHRNEWFCVFGAMQNGIIADNIHSGRVGYPDDIDWATDPEGDDPTSASPTFGLYIGRGIKLGSGTIDVDIHDNILRDVGATTCHIVACSRINIHDNHFISCGHFAGATQSTVVEMGDATGGTDGRSQYNRIVGNEFMRCRGEAIVIANASGGFGRHVVTGNVINNAYDGIVVTSSAGNTISDNRITVVGQYAIHLNGSSSQNQVVGNHLDTFTSGGIVLDNTATKNTVALNVINDNLTSAVGPLSTSGSSGKNLVRDNDIIAGTILLHADDKQSVSDTLTVDTNITNTGSFANVAGLSLSIYTHGGDLLLQYNGPLEPDAGNAVSLTFGVDGAAQATLVTAPGGGPRVPVSMSVLRVSVAAGSHTITVMGVTAGGTAVIPATQGVCQLIATEV